MLVTIFSATDYGGMHRSDGAYVSFTNKLAPRITTYSAHRDIKIHSKASVIAFQENNANSQDASHVDSGIVTASDHIEVHVNKNNTRLDDMEHHSGVSASNHKKYVCMQLYNIYIYICHCG